MADEGEKATKTYRGNCHCGNFVFELKRAEITKALECNCSICSKKGYCFVFPTGTVTVLKGEGTLTDYTFGTKKYKHRFCPTCGTPVMISNDTGPPGQGVVNARCIQDLDIWKLEADSTFDGKKLDPQYEAPAYNGPEPAPVEGGKVYHGSCHCGAVTVAVNTEPLDNTYNKKILECNCSICQRNAYIWIYPRAEQVAVQGAENMTNYRFATKMYQKGFCKICGVQILNKRIPLTDNEVAALPEEYRQRRGPYEITPVNLRMFNHLDLKTLPASQMGRNDGWHNYKPLYVNP